MSVYTSTAIISQWLYRWTAGEGSCDVRIKYFHPVRQLSGQAPDSSAVRVSLASGLTFPWKVDPGDGVQNIWNFGQLVAVSNLLLQSRFTEGSEYSPRDYVFSRRTQF